MLKKTVSVIGLGYIGLPTAALLASKGYQVSGIDINQEAIDLINNGQAHIYEPDLENLVKFATSCGNLKAYKDYVVSDIYIICVPTPVRDVELGKPCPDIDNVISAVLGLAPLIKAGDLIILESTCPVGTTQKVEKVLRDCGLDTEAIHIAYCPERVLPGKIMTEIVLNDRIVGGLTDVATDLAADFYKTFVEGKVLKTNSKTAELCKLTENSFRDVNIAFANELSLICDEKNINVWELIRFANLHPRVDILSPGPGVGGHCIAIDPWFIVSEDPKNAQLILKARQINDYKPSWVVKKISAAAEDVALEKKIRPTIACFGLSFKPNIDDLRESPALKIALELGNKGYNVVAVEPNIESYKNLKLVSIEDALKKADVFALLVCHKEFVSQNLKSKLKKKTALDFCGMML